MPSEAGAGTHAHRLHTHAVHTRQCPSRHLLPPRFPRAWELRRVPQLPPHPRQQQWQCQGTQGIGHRSSRGAQGGSGTSTHSSTENLSSTDAAPSACSHPGAKALGSGAGHRQPLGGAGHGGDRGEPGPCRGHGLRGTSSADSPDGGRFSWTERGRQMPEQLSQPWAARSNNRRGQTASAYPLCTGLCPSLGRTP